MTSADSFTISGNLVDIIHENIYPAKLHIAHGSIQRIERLAEKQEKYLLPGFIDAHIHIESSMLPPSEFARTALIHGTVAVVADAHEIANVMGVAGINWMIADGKRVPLKFYFGAPCCVPATIFETSGATIPAKEVAKLLASPDIHHLAEVMNYPAVVAGDRNIMAMIKAAKEQGKRVDGHAPALRGADLAAYAAAGISSDHESVSLDEARMKIMLGMKALIREGSAAKNSAELLPLINEFPDDCMFCSDDLHPEDLYVGHINLQVHEAVAEGIPLMRVLRCATLNPVLHYKLAVGMLQPGDSADFIELADLHQFIPLRTFVAGKLVAENGVSNLPVMPVIPINNFAATSFREAEFAVPASKGLMKVIKVIEHQLLTEQMLVYPLIVDKRVISDPQRDILKIAVVNRYYPAPPALAFASGFGLKSGAFASSIAHDSHNIIAVATDDKALCSAVNALISMQGGLVVINGDECLTLPLPIAGLMSTRDINATRLQYNLLVERVKSMGSTLQQPFMMLSFMALLVIPRLKISDRGIFDSASFSLVELFDE